MKIRNLALIICLLVALAISPATGVSAVSVQASVPPNITLEPVLSGLTQPIFATHAGDGSGRLFIVQQTGEILIYDEGTLNPTPFLDVSSLIETTGGEQGLLGLAFDPNYSTNGYFYIFYTPPTVSNEAIRLARYEVSSGNPDVADDTSAEILLTIPKPEGNHNGGMIAFGPDGYLYMSTGDGGGGGDPQNNGQNKNSLLGKILRLDVNPAPPYTSPPSNPFVDVSGSDEIWSYGLRNPWRFSFDKTTGDLYIGDVGQGVYEEIDYQPASSTGGHNYGWRIREGNACYPPASSCVSPPAYVAPVATYNHEAGCSVTGGYVYRGTAFPGLVGVYLFGDYCSGNLWGLVRNASNQWVKTLVEDTDYNISSFAEDEQGELYLLHRGGQLIHITQHPIVSVTFKSGPIEDGLINETTETSGVGGSINAGSTILKVGDTIGDRQVRAILSFNTSGLPDNAIITSAQIRINRQSFTGASAFASLGQLVADMGVPSFGTSPVLQNSDFQAAADYNRAVIFSAAPVDRWYSAGLMRPSLALISLTSLTQFRLRFSKDDNDNQANNLVNFWSGNASANQPELIINYYLE